MPEPKKFWTKALRNEEEPLAYRPFRWLFSRRAYLVVTEVQLQCGDWVIPFDSLKEAVIYEFESIFFVKGYLLVVKTDNGSFQFGLNPSAYWEGDLPFPVRREQKTLGGLWIRRALFLGAILYGLWTEYSRWK